MLSRLKNTKTWQDGTKLRVYENNEFAGLGVVNLNKQELSVLKLFNL